MVIFTTTSNAGTWCTWYTFCFSHRLRETSPTENEPTVGRSGAPPASLAGICLSEPSHWNTDLMNTANIPTYQLGRRQGKQGPRPPVSNHVDKSVDKSANGRLLRCKINTLVSTFNIRSLNSSEKIGELTALAEEKEKSVVCLQEHRKFHDSEDVHYTDVGKGWILATSSCRRKSVNSCGGGMGMLLSLSAYKSLEGNAVVENSCIIMANFNGNPATTYYYMLLQSNEMLW